MDSRLLTFLLFFNTACYQGFSQEVCKQPSYDTVNSIIHAENFDYIADYFSKLGGILTQDTIRNVPANQIYPELKYRQRKTKRFEFCRKSNQVYFVYVTQHSGENLSLSVTIYTNDINLFRHIMGSIVKYNAKNVETGYHGDINTDFYITTNNDDVTNLDRIMKGLNVHFHDSTKFNLAKNALDAWNLSIEFEYHK